MAKNISILLFIQALLTILLFFSENYLRTVTIFLYVFFDIIILLSLFRSKWGAEEMYIFLTFFTSVIYLVFYTYMQRNSVIMIGIGLFLLWVLSALLVIDPKQQLRQLVIPSSPDSSYPSMNEYAGKYEEDFVTEFKPKVKSVPKEFGRETEDNVQVYDVDQLEREFDNVVSQKRYEEDIPPLKSKMTSDAKVRAKAMAYELEREAAELKRAENYINKKTVEHQQSELEKEAGVLKRMESYLKDQSIKRDEKELIKEALALEEVEKVLNAKAKRLSKPVVSKKSPSKVSKISKSKISKSKSSKVLELEKEANSLENAEQQLKNIEFLNKQQELNRQAVELAKIQAKINAAQNILKSQKVVPKTKKSSKSSKKK
jgi:hypothetical protein